MGSALPTSREDFLLWENEQLERHKFHRHLRSRRPAQRDDFQGAPKLVIEALSPTTQACNRSRKFALYRRMASLQEYALVEPDTRRIEVFRVGADGLWVLHDMS